MSIEKRPPSQEDLWNHEEVEGIRLVSSTLETISGRGVVVRKVFHREEDDTYWRAQYRVTLDYETDELREGRAEVDQVVPVQAQCTLYMRPNAQSSYVRLFNSEVETT